MQRHKTRLTTNSRSHLHQPASSQFQRPGLPWRGFSFEEGYAFTHLDGFLLENPELELTNLQSWVDPGILNPPF